MKRITAWLAALAMILGLAVGVAAPANAYGTGNECVSYNGVTTCARVTWINGSAGKVIWTGTQVETPSGCGNLESDGAGRYGNFKTYGSYMGTIQSYYETGANPCNFGVGRYDSMPSDTHMYVEVKARVNNAFDKKVVFHWRIRRDGGVTLVEKYYTDLSSCC